MFVPICSVFLGFLLSVSAFAAAPVSEIGRPSQPSTTTVVVPPLPAVQPQSSGGDAHYQMQVLQDEVRTLRGMVEELNNEIRQLKKRQMDDYVDLDRRLSTLVVGGGRGSSTSGAGGSDVNGSVNTKTASSGNTSSAQSSSASSSQDAEQRDQYNNAYNQLKAGKVADAVKQFKAHIAKYPNGLYVANSHYWLGEIYVLQNELELARQSFTTILERYPAHRKAPDSTFKLGQVYFMMGNKGKSKELLEKAATGNDNAARLARSYLSENF